MARNTGSSVDQRHGQVGCCPMTASNAFEAYADRAVDQEFAQIARDHDLSGNVADLLDRFAQLEREIVRALGGDQFPPPPVHLVAGRP